MVITALNIPCAATGDRFGFHELARRHGDYAMAGVIIAVPADSSPRAVFFGVADRPLLIPELEACLADHLDDGDPASLDRAIACLDGIEMVSDTHASEVMRRHLCGVVLKRAVEGME